MQDYKHLDKTDKQLSSWYKDKVRKGKIGNMDFDIFRKWYLSKATCCHYCGLTSFETQQIVRNGKLTSRRFPQNGIHGRGTSRGMWLEIDRYDPSGKYEIGNIVPACYFCNNDKSDIFHGDNYKIFMKDRIGFLKRMLTLFILCLTVSCSISFDQDTISENEARKLVIAEFQKESPNLVEVFEFKKTDGLKQEMFGQKGYLMNYHIKIKFLQNAHQHFTVPQSVYFKPDNYFNSKKVSKGDYYHYKKGEIMEFYDKNLFQKTENGWNY